MPLSADLAEKSVQAAIAAIEIYNKPNFSYREEAFSLLMTNAWELLLKAKWLVDRAEAVESLYEMIKAEPDGSERPKVNGSGNPISHGLVYLAARMVEDKNSGLEPASNENILALVEIRNNAAHLVNKDLYIGRRVQEIGTASLRNYLTLATEWFGLDLSIYNFFLMPISFYHGFETAEPVSRAAYSEQVQNLLSFIDAREATEAQNEGNQHVALHLETRLVRGKDAAAIEFRYTDDPKAPAISIREQDVFKNYPMTYRDLSDAMKRRYSNFLENRAYHRLRQAFEREQKFCIVRLLNPQKPDSSKQRFYNANIFQEFDKHYTRRKKESGLSLNAQPAKPAVRA
jgi:hypothetical protein